MTNTQTSEAYQEDPATLRAEYGLFDDYNASYAQHVARLVGFAGKAVLEIGGTMTPRFVFDYLKAARWVCVNPDAARMLQGHYGEDWQGVVRDTPVKTASDTIAEDDYAIISAGISDVDPDLTGRFDVIFAMATLEHVRQLPTALKSIEKLLKVGGVFVSLHAPIWSGPAGHHVLANRIGEKTGNAIAIPPWAHLLISQSEMYGLLSKQTSPDDAAELVDEIYNNPYLNRLFFDDYIAYAAQSNLEVVSIRGFARQDIPENARQILATRYPGLTGFEYGGQEMILRRS